MPRMLPSGRVGRSPIGAGSFIGRIKPTQLGQRHSSSSCHRHQNQLWPPCANEDSASVSAPHAQQLHCTTRTAAAEPATSLGTPGSRPDSLRAATATAPQPGTGVPAPVCLRRCACTGSCRGNSALAQLVGELTTTGPCLLLHFFIVLNNNRSC